MKRIAIASDRQNPEHSAFTYKWNYANEAYTSCIYKAGALPFIIPYTELLETDEIVKNFDALMLIGGADISPSLYGESVTFSKNCDIQLDRFHLSLVTSARKYKVPVLGICRGFQLINVAFGGTLYQDIESEKSVSIPHAVLDKPYEEVHDISILEDSLLYKVFNTSTIGVNSLHHQGIKTLGFGLKTSAVAPDNLIEAFEVEDNVFAVQWHPEAMGDKMQPLFDTFIKSLEKKSLIKELASELIP